MLAGDRGAVSPALNLIDDRRPERRDAALRLLDGLYAAADGSQSARRVGLTGAPGAGKSTLLDALVRNLREANETVGIIAVDPSSQRSGGALLGDRFRVRSGAADPGVFLRSMAARDRLGGLSDAAYAGIAVLSAVFDWVFVETVGVGQSESDVARMVDTLVYVAQPAAGDSLQYMKAGLVELPDIFIVNKSDMGAPAERTHAEIQAGLGLAESAPADDWQPPVLLVSSRDGVGIAELIDATRAHRRHLDARGLRLEKRAAAELAFLVDTLERRYGSHGIERWGGRSAIEERLRLADGISPFAMVRQLSAEIEDALNKPATSA